MWTEELDRLVDRQRGRSRLRWQQRQEAACWGLYCVIAALGEVLKILLALR